MIYIPFPEDKRMLLKPFTIISHNESLQIDEESSILINMEQLVSIKPIKISTESRDIIDGYWVRLSNGKKYRAIQVPDIVLDALKEDLSQIQKNKDTEVEIPIH